MHVHPQRTTTHHHHRSTGAAVLLRLVVILPTISLAGAAEPSVTIYNDGFAVVRDRIPLALPAGNGTIAYPGASAHVETDSVQITVPAGVRIRELTYRNDPVSVDRLLQIFEGRTIQVEVSQGSGPPRIADARILRASARPHQEAWNRYGRAYVARQQYMMGWGNGGNAVMLEMDGRIRFGLPGTPLFPSLPEGTDLRPTLTWQVQTAAATDGAAEIAYLSGGFSWESTYALMIGKGDATASLSGLMTIDNQSGTDLIGAQLKCVAGDVAKISGGYGMDQDERPGRKRQNALDMIGESFSRMDTRATDATFGDWYLYALPERIDLRDRETKQIGFLDAPQVATGKRLVYDGQHIRWEQYQRWSQDDRMRNRDFGSGWNTKVEIERLVANTAENHLGRPLPAGVVRCYLPDGDGRPEFVGESRIDHTPVGELLRLRTGSTFDLVGERVQTDFQVDTDRKTCRESYRIQVRNRGPKPAEVTVVEHLYRGLNWSLPQCSAPWSKRDARTIEIPVQIPALGEATVSYQAVYTW